MNKIKVTILVSSIMALFYVVLYCGFKMTVPGFLNSRLTYSLFCDFCPFMFIVITLILFLTEYFRFKKANWFYFFIISINLFTHTLSLIFF